MQIDATVYGCKNKPVFTYASTCPGVNVMERAPRSQCCRRERLRDEDRVPQWVEVLFRSGGFHFFNGLHKNERNADNETPDRALHVTPTFYEQTCMRI